LRLNDTHLVLILRYAAFFMSLSTWIMRAFIDQVPRELEEAALVDGAGMVQMLRMMVLPLVMSGVIAASLFVIVYECNEFIFALVFTTRIARTTDGVDWGALCAAATLQLAPVLAFILAAQRYIIAGLTAGAVKAESASGATTPDSASFAAGVRASLTLDARGLYPWRQPT
jgi:multiple sugar transport system permease protein